MFKVVLCFLLLISFQAIASNDTYFCKATERQTANGDGIMCPQIFTETCGWLNSEVMCIEPPCSVEGQNVCELCKNPQVEFVTSGKCPQLNPEIVIEPIPQYFCKPAERANANGEGLACPQIFTESCGYFNSNVFCIMAPCATNGSSNCELCQNADVEYVTPGKCPEL